MSHNGQEMTVEQVKKVGPILAASLILGVLSAGVVLVPMDIFQQPPQGQMISLIMAGLAGVCFLASMIVPNIISNSMLGKSSAVEDKRYATVYQTQMIIRFALLEGPALANLIALSQEGNPWSLGIIIWLVLTMILFFPTPGRIDAWIKQKKEFANFEQQDADSY